MRSKKKRDKKMPLKNVNSVAYHIHSMLQKGVSTKAELCVKIYEYFESNKIYINTKNKKVTIEGIINNVNETLRYILEHRTGWYYWWDLSDDGQVLKIVLRTNFNNKKRP